MMADLINSPRARIQTPATALGTLDVMTSVVITVAVVAGLFFAREILVPIALAVLMSFLLAPLVVKLRKIGVKQAIAVVLVVFFAFLVIVGIGTVLVRQGTQLAADLPRYQTTVSQKIEAVRGATAGVGVISRMSDAVQRLSQQLRPKTEPTPAPAARASDPNTDRQPVPVIVQEPERTPLELLRDMAPPLLSPLGTFAIVVIFAIFILIQREDLRDRIIRLAGSGDLQRTTAALDDAAHRLSRYFLAQTAVNAVFGLVIGTGLWLIGVPSPALWGAIAMLARFVPYVGAIGAAVLPLILAVAVDPGWSMVLETLALFVIVEPLVGQVVEPLLYGHSTGLSPIAVVVAATFWTWLWGPVGLLMSTPLTVCLVVLGRHVDRLEFLDILLGDTPALTPVEGFYQRMLAGHPAEASEQAERFLKTGSLSAYYDEIALPGLLMAQTDIRRGHLDEDRQTKLRDTVAAVIDDLSDHDDIAPPTAESVDDSPAGPIAPEPAHLHRPPVSRGIDRAELGATFLSDKPVRCVAGRTPLDESASAILAQLLEKHGLGARVEPVAGSTGVAPLDAAGVALVCVSFLDVESYGAHVRYMLRRLRRRMPQAKIMACFWTAPADAAWIRDLCAEAKVDFHATDLTKAIEVCLEVATVREAAATATAA